MNKTPKYAIFTVGRTGSQLVCRNLSKYYNCKQFAPGHNMTSGVLHSHYALWEPPDPEWICVLSKRKNDFEGMCSNYIASQTREYVKYTNLEVVPFEIEYESFVTNFEHRRLFYQAVDQAKFSKTITVWYEELITDPGYLFGQLGISQETDLTVLAKSTYDYKKIIKNWEQALEWYTQLAATRQFTQDDLETWKTTAKKHSGDHIKS
jgi:hypothetical protein